MAQCSVTTASQSYHCFPVIGLARFVVTWRLATCTLFIARAVCIRFSRGGCTCGRRDRRAETRSVGACRDTKPWKRLGKTGCVSCDPPGDAQWKIFEPPLRLETLLSGENAIRFWRHFHLSSKLRASLFLACIELVLLILQLCPSR